MKGNLLVWIGAGVGVAGIAILAATVDLWPGASGGSSRSGGKGAPGSGGRFTPARASANPASKPSGFVRVDDKGTIQSNSSIPVYSLPISVEQSVAEVLDPATGKMRQVPFTRTVAAIPRAPGAKPLDAKVVDIDAVRPDGLPYFKSEETYKGPSALSATGNPATGKSAAGIGGAGGKNAAGKNQPAAGAPKRP